MKSDDRKLDACDQVPDVGYWRSGVGWDLTTCEGGVVTMCAVAVMVTGCASSVITFCMYGMVLGCGGLTVAACMTFGCAGSMILVCMYGAVSEYASGMTL